MPQCVDCHLRIGVGELCQRCYLQRWTRFSAQPVIDIQEVRPQGVPIVANATGEIVPNRATEDILGGLQHALDFSQKFVQVGRNLSVGLGALRDAAQAVAAVADAAQAAVLAVPPTANTIAENPFAPVVESPYEAASRQTRTSRQIGEEQERLLAENIDQQIIERLNQPAADRLDANLRDIGARLRSVMPPVFDDGTLGMGVSSAAIAAMAVRRSIMSGESGRSRNPGPSSSCGRPASTEASSPSCRRNERSRYRHRSRSRQRNGPPMLAMQRLSQNSGTSWRLQHLRQVPHQGAPGRSAADESGSASEATCDPVHNPG